MSRENVETFKRVADAFNRRDVEALLRDFDPEVQFHSVLHEMFGGEAPSIAGTPASANSSRAAKDIPPLDEKRYRIRWP